MNGEDHMCGQRRELDGDPEAMLRFAARVGQGSAPVDVDPVIPPCPGGMRGCAVFAAADMLSTAALAEFVAETEHAVAALRAASFLAAQDYLASDLAGALDLLGATRPEA
ncbi:MULTISPECIES: hypothetical protein [Actinokineospora]|uniref:Uncharacterized protein n=1 Tax=Actinokineospora fastidiosa TaxID=1816 RepID=A0A918GDA6_9PSEU|nr:MULTISPECIES: hypothetical protein [Actinokineospora]UVS79624.1 hypothetical protein Actkin_03374 [Actinokineospora sp. UTMC 2448]GGS29959.1 hypothetical protein GCM10010171_24190 [Actinokineospora fastidiosa]